MLEGAQAFRGLGISCMPLQDGDHLLCCRQVARTQQDHHPVTGVFKDIHLAVGSDVIDAGIGA